MFRLLSRGVGQGISNCNLKADRITALTRHLCGVKSNAGMTTNGNPTAGIIVIGDEILKGHVQDTNSHFLCRRLFSLGVKVKRISVISDDLDVIAKEVAEFSEAFTHVITCGGIGPTHDDLTFEGVARAFNEDVFHHPDLVAVCKMFFGTDDVTSPKLKLALVPKSSELHYGIDKVSKKKNKYPIVKVKNVFVFPGVPPLLERAFSTIEDHLHNPTNAFHVKEVFIKKDEMSITPILNDLDAKFKNRVILGSYPEFHNSYYKVKLTLESEKQEYLEEANEFLQTHLPTGSIVTYIEDPIGRAQDEVYRLVQAVDQSEFNRTMADAVQTIEECFDKYGPDHVCVGFNGGKDCTAILHLTHAVYKRKYPDRAEKLQSLYIRRGTPFPELELFITKSAEKYGLDQLIINGRIKEALTELKSSHPHIEAVVMGTRRTDPYSAHLSSFIMTDTDWPQFMRVNPILDWSYSEVWTFLRLLCVPYCSLYDSGYTSLGSMENTHPNPDLRVINDKGIVHYRPAYQLTNALSERAGRN